MQINVLSLQRLISQAINREIPGDSDFGAFRCTSKDGDEYVEVCNRDHSESYIITIVKRG